MRLTIGRIALAARRRSIAKGQLLDCILLPSDGMALFLVRAPNESWVKDQSGLSELPFDRIVESIQVGFDQQPS